MRIVIVAPEQIPVPPVLGGSVEITILAIAKQLAKHHSVTVISRSHPRYPQRSVVGGVKIYRVPTGSPGRYLENVRRFLSGKSIDVIQIDNRPRFVAPIKRMFPRATVSLFLHSLTFVSSRKAAAPGLDAADLIIANSLSLKHQLSRRFPRAAGKIRKVWLGVDTGRFRPGSRKKESRAMTLLFAGRLIPRKGLPVMLKAVKLARRISAKPLKVIVAGGGMKSDYASKMRKLAESLGVPARFLGTVPHSRIDEVYRKADVFVCPSQKHEAFGLVNVEAMASGLPVIASRNGGIREIVRHGHNGFLVTDYQSPKAFAQAIVRLADNPALLNRMKRAARRDCVDRFSWAATGRRLSRIYKSPRSSADS